MRKGKQLMEHSMSDAILNQIKADAFERGIKTALNELRDVYGEGLDFRRNRELGATQEACAWKLY
jgi:hypothetical protein